MNSFITETRSHLILQSDNKDVRQKFLLAFYILQDVVLFDASSDFIHLVRDDTNHWFKVSDWCEEHDCNYHWESSK